MPSDQFSVHLSIINESGIWRRVSGIPGAELIFRYNPGKSGRVGRSVYLKLRRRKNYSSLYDVGNCLMVSINIQIIACMSGRLLMCIMVVGI